MPQTRPLRPISAAAAAALDVLAICAGLIVFALFHHVLPETLTPAETPAPTATLAVPEKTPADEPATTPTPVAETPRPSLTGTEVFSDGATVETATSYQSENVSVTVARYKSNGAYYYVEDIYIRSIENIQTAFAGDAYGKGLREHPLTLATAKNAICAINGDYYGTSATNGAVIRNGVLYRDNPDGDVCVLYRDGTMETVSASAFDGEAAIENSAYQAWCFGPALLKGDGTAITTFSGNLSRKNPRSGIGYYSPGHYCFVAVDGRTDESGGMTLKEFAALFEKLGCIAAYNLDGGKSSVLTFGDTVVNDPVGGGRASSDIIFITE